MSLVGKSLLLGATEALDYAKGNKIGSSTHQVNTIDGKCPCLSSTYRCKVCLEPLKFTKEKGHLPSNFGKK